MESFQETIVEYRKQLERGAIQVAYRGLMEYIMGLRIHFKNKYPDTSVSGSIYYGYDLFFHLSKNIKKSKIEDCDRVSS